MMVEEPTLSPCSSVRHSALLLSGLYDDLEKYGDAMRGEVLDLVGRAIIRYN
jgi:hypothetical protein